MDTAPDTLNRTSDGDQEEDEDSMGRPAKLSLYYEDSQMPTRVLAMLDMLRRNKRFCDVVLQAGREGAIYAHRAVLACASSRLLEIFDAEEEAARQLPTLSSTSSLADLTLLEDVKADDGNKLDDTETKLSLHRNGRGGLSSYKLDVGREALRALVNYAYTGKLDVPPHLVKDVYIAAVALKMDSAANACSAHLLANLDVSSCIALRALLLRAPPRGVKKVELGVNRDSEGSAFVDSTASRTSAASKSRRRWWIQRHRDLARKIDKFMQSQMSSLAVESSELQSLPRVQIEILRSIGLDENEDEDEEEEEEEGDLDVETLCQLVVDWVHQQAKDSGYRVHSERGSGSDTSGNSTPTSESDHISSLVQLSSRRQMLFLDSQSATLKDCRSIPPFSTCGRLDIVQDYRKMADGMAALAHRSRNREFNDSVDTNVRHVNGHGLPPSSAGSVSAIPSKRTVLLNRHQNLPLKDTASTRTKEELEAAAKAAAKEVEAEEDIDANDWKVIACTQVAEHSTLAVAVLWGELATVSIMQRSAKKEQVKLSDSCAHTPAATPTNLSSADESSSALSSDGTKRKKKKKHAGEHNAGQHDLIAPMSSARCSVGCVVLDGTGKILVCGGYDRGECLRTVELYSGESNSWTIYPSMREARGRLSIGNLICKMGHLVIAVGGSNGTTELATVEGIVLAPDGSANQTKWRPLAPLPEPRSNAGVCILDERLYCVGGWDGQRGMKSCLVFTAPEFDNSAENGVSARLAGDRGSWSKVASLSVGRYQSAVCTVSGLVVAIGGCDAWNCLRSVEAYDPQKNEWNTWPQMTTARRGCGAAVMDGKLYVVGGSDGTHSLSSVEVLDVDSVLSSWHPGPNMNACRANVAVAVVNGRLYAVGGFSGKSFLNSMEYLEANSSTWTSLVPSSALTKIKVLHQSVAPEEAAAREGMENERKRE